MALCVAVGWLFRLGRHHTPFNTAAAAHFRAASPATRAREAALFGIHPGDDISWLTTRGLLGAP